MHHLPRIFRDLWIDTTQQCQKYRLRRSTSCLNRSEPLLSTPLSISHTSLKSIIPNRIHPKPRLLNIQMRHPTKKLLMPAINLHPPLLIITQRQPLIRPRTRAHSITMSSTRGRRIQTNLPLNITIFRQFKRRDVSREIWRI